MSSNTKRKKNESMPVMVTNNANPPPASNYGTIVPYNSSTPHQSSSTVSMSGKPQSFYQQSPWPRFNIFETVVSDHFRERSILENLEFQHKTTTLKNERVLEINIFNLLNKTILKLMFSLTACESV